MAPGPIRLFVFDFDGTALGGHEPYERFPEPFAQFLDRLMANGIAWATNTTWAPEKQLEIARRSGVRSEPALLTGQTGRLIASVRDGELVPNHSHEKAVLAAERQFKQRNWPTVSRVLLELLSEKLVRRIGYDFFSQNDIFFSCSEMDADRVWQKLQPLLASGQYYVWDPNNRTSNTLLMNSMNKGEPIRLMHRRFGLSPDQILVAGDETNDRHMFDPALARWMVCPANANPLIKDLVNQNEGEIGSKNYSWGVVEAATALLARVGQPLP